MIKEYEYGTFKIKVTVDGQTHYSEVTVASYPTYYAENVMKEYISKNIKSTMTGYEKLEKICEFVCSYDYSASASSYTGMILTGGGDCWASTSTIIYMCKQLGIHAHVRYAANDPGAGSGHRNAIAYVDGKYYEVEAGFDEKAPRYYSVTKTSEWGYKLKSDGTLMITQYDGKETNIKVPEKIDGKTVTEIGEQAFYYGDTYSGIEPVTITLPNTITKIDNLAFYGCDKLTKVNIPNSVKEIDGAPFIGATKVNIEIAANHPYFTISDNIIYNKNKTKVIECLDKKTGNVTLPNTVTTIGKSAFCRTNVTGVTLPNSLKTIEDGAFRESKISNITIPKSVTKIEDGAFYYSNLKNCVFEEGCTASIPDYTLVGCNFLQEVEIPSTIKTISENAFSSSSKTVIIGKKGTAAESYANKKKITFQEKGSVKLGDANGDGYIDASDAREVLKYCVGKANFTANQKKAADVNKDGYVDAIDAREILKYCVGKITKF